MRWLHKTIDSSSGEDQAHAYQNVCARVPVSVCLKQPAALGLYILEEAPRSFLGEHHSAFRDWHDGAVAITLCPQPSPNHGTAALLHVYLSHHSPVSRARLQQFGTSL